MVSSPATNANEGAMKMKRYADVKPGTYAGIPEGVQMREMITAEDGAPNFSLRVFDVKAGASTPFHSHAWEHEVYIVQGTGRVKTEDRETAFQAGDSVYIAPNEKHCFMADAASRFVCVVPVKDRCNL
jgi:quercetin dioxygenase-like cupin family protein